MTKPELTRSIRTLPIMLAMALMSAFGQTKSAPAQGALQGSNDVSLNDGVPREVENVTVEQNLGDRVALGLPLTDSRGRRVKTGYFIDGKKPTIITLNYSDCPMLSETSPGKAESYVDNSPVEPLP